MSQVQMFPMTDEQRRKTQESLWRAVLELRAKEAERKAVAKELKEEEDALRQIVAQLAEKLRDDAEAPRGKRAEKAAEPRETINVTPKMLEPGGEMIDANLPAVIEG